VTALALSDGHVEWRSELAAPDNRVTMIGATGGRVFGQIGACEVFPQSRPPNSVRTVGIDAATGATLWSQSTGWFGGIRPWMVGGGVLAVPSADGQEVLGLDVRRGRTVWRRSLDGLELGAGSSSVVVLRPAATTTSTRPVPPARLVTLDRRTGNVLWSKRLPAGSALEVVTATQDDVFFASGGTLDAAVMLDARSGTTRWTRSAVNGPNEPPPFVGLVSGTTVLGYAGDKVAGYSAATGDLVWTSTLQGHPIPLDVTGTVLLSYRRGTATGLDMRSGRTLWSRPEAPFGPVVASAGTQVVMPAHGERAAVRLVDARTGRTRWTAGQPRGADTAAVDRAVYVPRNCFIER
jgi:outer membrane protein assembly factor BamB